jgi:signal transduction histidine kinase
MVDGLLHSAGDLVAVLNEHQQIVAVNTARIKRFQADHPAPILDLRPGQTLRCLRSHQAPGAPRYCILCGAASAIAACLGTDRAEERTCAASALDIAPEAGLCSSVRAYPIELNERRVVLLFLRQGDFDRMTAAAEQTFCRDVGEVILGLMHTMDDPERWRPEDLDAAVDRVKMLTWRLEDEMAMQRVLASGNAGEYHPVMNWLSVARIIQELREVFANHPASERKTLLMRASAWDARVRSDFSMLVRVLCNVVTNALEATGDGGTVRLWVDGQRESTAFCVWNAAFIPRETAARIFGREFTTKEGVGRGMGTWAMKFFCESYLNGEVGFTTSSGDGTVFRVEIPSGIRRF